MWRVGLNNVASVITSLQWKYENGQFVERFSRNAKQFSSCSLISSL